MTLLQTIKRKVFGVTAGEVDKVIPIDESSKILDLSSELSVDNTKETINVSEYEMFLVKGESMCTSRIFNGDYIFVKLVNTMEEKLAIPRFSTIIFNIDFERERKRNPHYIPDEHLKYKLRKFVMFVHLVNSSNETIFASVLNVDKLSSFQGNRTRFMKKLADARDYFGDQLVVLSTTYKEGERDYSFHSIKSLAGRVEYYAKPDLKKVEKVIPVNEDANFYKEMVEHLALSKIPRFFYGINNKQASIVLSYIFKVSERIVRLVSTRLSEEITNDEEYKEAILSFLDRENTELEIFVYEYNDENPIYCLLSNYKEKIKLKFSPVGAEFRLPDDENKEKHIVNFCIGDDQVFRLERDTNLRMAECNFNDTKTSAHLIKTFKSIFNDSKLSETISLP